MRIVTVRSVSFGANTYLLISGDKAMAVDPSVSVSAITSASAAEGASLSGILLTHGHFDHVLNLDGLRDATGAEAYVHTKDAVMLTDGKKNAFYTFFGKERVWRPAERLISHGDTIPVGDESLTVIHTPGHTEGSVCYLCGDILVTGDTLFAQGYGRCDLWGGDIELMRSSLRRLSELPKSTVIYPGHGECARLRDALDNVAYLI